MRYDLFISYPHRDNENDRISELIRRVGHDFETFARRPLKSFPESARLP